MYENINKSFTRNKTSKEETVILDDSLDSNSSFSSESENYSNEAGKPQSPMIQILLTMKKSVSVPSSERKTIESTVAEMHLSLIN